MAKKSMIISSRELLNFQQEHIHAAEFAEDRMQFSESTEYAVFASVN